MTEQASTWIARLKKDDWDAAEYGSPIQTLVAAATPEEAKGLGANLLNVPVQRIEVFPYALGSEPEPVNPKPLAEEIAEMRGQ